jgi:Coenzyme PQQ synthesis protein D (PqqD)
MLIALDGIKAPISLHNCDEIVGPLGMVLGSWRFRVLENTTGHGTAAAISVLRASKSYRISSPWLDEPVVERSEVGAVFSVAAELARAFAEERPGLLCLHCAAVETDGRLILFPNSENAGKSTLATGLAARGFRLFADDVLAVSEVSQQGISLGIAPRLRLPLPRSCGTSFHCFVESHRGPYDAEFLYLNLNASQLALHGQTSPIGATVLLDRRRSGAPKLTSLARGRALRQLIIQNFAPDGTSLMTIDRLFSIIETGACFSFTYSKLDQAIDFLSERFSSGDAPWQDDRIDRVRGTRVSEIAVEVAQHRRPWSAQFTQVAGVALRAVDNDIFLVKSGDAAVFHLNAVAASLWHLLERPTTLATAVDAVQKAFPAADARKVNRDVRSVFDALHQAGLIRPWDRRVASHS